MENVGELLNGRKLRRPDCFLHGPAFNLNILGLKPSALNYNYFCYVFRDIL